MKKKQIRTRPIDLALAQLNRQLFFIVITFLIPPTLVAFVIAALTFAQGKIYPPVLDAAGVLVENSGKWYYDPFTIVIVVLFIFGQVMALRQFIDFHKIFIRMRKLIRVISNSDDLEELADLRQLADRLRNSVPHSDIRSLVLNWLDYRGDSTVKRNDVLENNNYIRMDLTREKTSYLHVMLNRITLKLGFLGTLLGLMRTFPKMKNAILSLEGGQGEMTFINDIAAAIDGDQYAILTTLIATLLSLFGEFLTIQFVNRFSVNNEIIMSYLTDWYHTRVEPLYANGSSDSIGRMEDQFSRAEEVLAKNMQVLSTLAAKNAEQLAKLADFHNTIEKRVTELESYETHYRKMMETKGKAEEHLAGNISVLTDVAEKTGGQLKGLVSSQEIIGARVETLQQYEEQYRSLISAKDAAGIPNHLRPNGGN